MWRKISRRKCRVSRPGNIVETANTIRKEYPGRRIYDSQSPRPFLMEWTRLAERKKYRSFSFQETECLILPTSLIDKPQCDGTEYRGFCINRQARYVTGECPGGSKELPAVPDKQAPRDTSHVPCTAPIYQTSYRGREVCMGGKPPDNTRLKTRVFLTHG